MQSSGALQRGWGQAPAQAVGLQGPGAAPALPPPDSSRSERMTPKGKKTLKSLCLSLEPGKPGSHAHERAAAQKSSLKPPQTGSVEKLRSLSKLPGSRPPPPPQVAGRDEPAGRASCSLLHQEGLPAAGMGCRAGAGQGWWAECSSSFALTHTLTLTPPCCPSPAGTSGFSSRPHLPSPLPHTALCSNTTLSPQVLPPEVNLCQDDSSDGSAAPQVCALSGALGTHFLLRRPRAALRATTQAASCRNRVPPGLSRGSCQPRGRRNCAPHRVPGGLAWSRPGEPSRTCPGPQLLVHRAGAVPAQCSQPAAVQSHPEDPSTDRWPVPGILTQQV